MASCSAKFLPTRILAFDSPTAIEGTPGSRVSSRELTSPSVAANSGGSGAGQPVPVAQHPASATPANTNTINRCRTMGEPRFRLPLIYATCVADGLTSRQADTQLCANQDD